MVKNNKGFSMVELIVSISILTVVALTCGMFISTGSDIFGRTDARERLQYKTQIVLMQLKEYAAASNVISVVDNDLYLIGTDKEGDKYLYEFDYDAEEKTITYKKDNFKREKDGTIVTGDEVTQEQPLATGVANVNYEIVKYDSEGKTADAIKIELTATTGTKSYTKQYIVSLKTKPLLVNLSGTDKDVIREAIVKTQYK